MTPTRPPHATLIALAVMLVLALGWYVLDWAGIVEIPERLFGETE